VTVEVQRLVDTAAKRLVHYQVYTAQIRQRIARDRAP
ncbi:uncharacterized protein METZ01_LOCUS361062, partial [marine metagenome]